jgi:divalent metal cation (Fe/Co/Zn/Cd) transporter
VTTQPTAKLAAHDHDDDHNGHGHSHGLVDRSIIRSREGVKAVSISLAVLGVAAGIQLAIFTLSGSVALLADLIHNFGDALTAVPLGIAFFLRSVRGERFAGLAVVLAIFVSACVALYETILRFIHPSTSPTSGSSPWRVSSASSGTRSLPRYASTPASGSRAPL